MQLIMEYLGWEIWRKGTAGYYVAPAGTENYVGPMYCLADCKLYIKRAQ